MISIVRAHDDLKINVNGTGVKLTYREALELWVQLSGSIAPTRLLEITRAGTRCPACSYTTEHGESPVYEIDAAYRHNETELDMRDDGPQLYVVQGDGDFETITYCCNHCHEPLGMPAEIDVNWS